MSGFVESTKINVEVFVFKKKFWKKLTFQNAYPSKKTAAGYLVQHCLDCVIIMFPKTLFPHFKQLYFQYNLKSGSLS